jgi:hypothetical protein
MLSCRKARRSQLIPSDAIVTRLLLLVLVKLPGQITKLARSLLTKSTKSQEKLLAAHTKESLDKVANFCSNYQNCHYAILQKSKKKSVVSFRCTRYQVTAPGLGETPWTNYKACEKFIDKINKESKNNVQLLDMKNHSRSCPGKMFVHIANVTVGLPHFPPPFHLCGNVSHIRNMDQGQQDLHPSFQLISPTVLFMDVFSIDKRQAIINILDKKLSGAHLLVDAKGVFMLLILPVSQKSTR